MGDYRARSFADDRRNHDMYQIQSYGYHYSSSSSYAPPPPPLALPPPTQLKRGKSSRSTSRSWSLNDPELQRKKRVASYKVYSVEGKVKGSFKRNFRWLRDKYTHVVYGWW